MSLTTDPTDPRLIHGTDESVTGQHDVYLVLSAEERAKGFLRPLYRAYYHSGRQPRYPLRDLTPEEVARYPDAGYVAFEPYPESESPKTGRYWTQAELDRRGCLTLTTMGLELCETWARSPSFYSATYCCGCGKHLPVNEFEWADQHGIPTGVTVGS